MKIHGRRYRTIWLHDDSWSVEVIDQTRLPHEFEVKRLTSPEAAADAIVTMVVRGAPLIGVTAAYGLCLAMRNDPTEESLDAAVKLLAQTRPTAVNLNWALSRMATLLKAMPPEERMAAAYAEAARIADEDVECCHAIGDARRAPHPRGAQPHRPGRQYPHPLQCGLARNRGLGHRARADLRRP